MPQLSPVTHRHQLPVGYLPWVRRRSAHNPELLQTEEEEEEDAEELKTSATSSTPFSYFFQPSLRDYVIMSLMVPVLPFRLLLIILSMLLAWLVGKMALYRNPPQIVNAAPFVGWRKACRETILWCSRCLFFAFAIQRIKFVRSSGSELEGDEDEGHFEESDVAPLLISAPHVSYLDAFISGCVSLTPVIKASAGLVPVIGPFLTALQPIFVNREIAESRQSTKEALVKRCEKEKGVWPPVLIFPEGTTGNGKCLFKFKLGAFYPGQPLQITSIEYKTFMSNWNPYIFAWDSGVPVWKSMLYVLLQPHTTAVIHLLPVYYPSDQERKDPGLFAANVQKLLAEYLQVPATEYTYENARDYVRSLRKKTV